MTDLAYPYAAPAITNPFIADGGAEGGIIPQPCRPADGASMLAIIPTVPKPQAPAAYPPIRDESPPPSTSP